jgi:phosphoribosylanthranilate isomerase
MILKICGITNQEDATAAVEGGATALGFNFFPGSPRFIAPECAAGILTPAGVRRVGIFVDEERARVEEIVRVASLDVAQLHGEEMPVRYPGNVKVWKAVRVGPDFDPSLQRFGLNYEQIPAEAILLDGPASGEPFEWLKAGIQVHGTSGYRERRVIIAGGLDASNVAQATLSLRWFWGVDACSRIESSPGKKDHQKMKDFLQAARRALEL